MSPAIDVRPEGLKPGIGRPVAVKCIRESSSSSSAAVAPEIRGSKSES